MVLSRRFWMLLVGSMIFATRSVQVAAQRSGAAEPEDKKIASEFAGCYNLSAGEWSRGLGRGPRSAPVMVRLDTTVVDISGRIRFAAQVTHPPADPPPPESGSPHLQSSWWPVGADSIELLTWSDGFSAEVLYLRAEAGGFRGVARRTSDAIPVDEQGNTRWEVWPWATVAARRIACRE